MAVPTTIADISTTAASNSPAGSDSIGTSADDFLRSIQAIMKQQVSTGTQLASSTTITPLADGNFINVTGTTTITTIASTNSWNGRVIWMKFTGALQLTHSSTLVMPGAMNYTTRANDVLAFVQESSGTWRCVSIQNHRDTVSVKDFGAVGDGTTDDTDAINAASLAVSTAGGGELHFPAGTYIISATLNIYSKVVFVGAGSAVTEIKLANNSDCDMIKSYNYATLAGSDTWLVSAGCTHGYGLMRLRLNGNKANQASGDGCKFYGKRLRIDDVIITDVKGEGWHSESNYSIPGAQATNGDDLPEGLIRGLYVRLCGSHGVVWRGQHDSVIQMLVSESNGGWGARFETSDPDNYSGSADIRMAHIYANVSGGTYVSSTASNQFGLLICENNDGVGFQCDGWQVKVDTLQLYNNNRVTGDYQAIIAGSECIISETHSKLAKAGKGHISITGNKNRINATVVCAATDGAAGSVAGISATGDDTVLNCTIDGNGSAGIGLDIDNNNTKVEAKIREFSATGGIALRTNNGGARIGCDINAYLLDSKTLWNHVTTGNLATYNIRGYANAGQTCFSGQGPNANDSAEHWTVTMYDTDASHMKRSEIRKISSAVDLNTTTEQEFTIDCTELLGLTPEPEDVQFGLYYTGTNTTFAVQYLKLHAVSASALTFRIKLSTAAGGAASGYIAATVKL